MLPKDFPTCISACRRRDSLVLFCFTTFASEAGLESRSKEGTRALTTLLGSSWGRTNSKPIWTGVLQLFLDDQNASHAATDEVERKLSHTGRDLYGCWQS